MSEAPKVSTLPRFPFYSHRTLAEVAETEELEALVLSGDATQSERARFATLHCKRLRVLRECGL